MGAPPPPGASSALARRVMQGNRRRDTAPEMRLRRRLHAAGLRYRVDFPPVADLRRRADIVFTRHRVAVFVDGCFWHGCEQHGTRPRTNAAYWSAKIDANQTRDRDTDRRLEQYGWLVVRIWEHEDEAAAAARVFAALRKARPDDPH